MTPDEIWERLNRQCDDVVARRKLVEELARMRAKEARRAEFRDRVILVLMSLVGVAAGALLARLFMR